MSWFKTFNSKQKTQKAQTFHISHMRISQKLKGVLMIFADSQICISVPLK